MPHAREPGLFLEALLLEGDPEHSEGRYSMDRWAVRLGCDPRSDEAKMASLHEAYHGLLNDSTAFGSLLHVVALLYRELPDDPRHGLLLTRLMNMALETHELYATYVSSFLVGRGHARRDLLAAYPDYLRYLDVALAIERCMPNPIVGFQLVQSVTRAAMQADFLARFLQTPAERWDDVEVLESDRPDVRLRALDSLDSFIAAGAALARWAAGHESPEIREVMAARLDADAEYDRQIDERLDPAIDAIGVFLYEHCRRKLAARHHSCLEYNGHQANTAALRAHVAPLLPTLRRGRELVAAPEGSQLTDLLAGFADEQLVLDPHPLRATWLWLDEVPEERWRDLLTGGPRPHALVVVRPWPRVCAQYDFGSRGPPPASELGTLVALRRRAIEPDSRPTVEFILVRTPAQLERMHERLRDIGDLFASCSMSVLASPPWQHAWLPTLRMLRRVSVLIDVNPFHHLRGWESQAKFDTHYATMTLHDEVREHIVFALYPRTGDDLLYVAPCSPTIVASLVTELRRLAARCGRFARNDEILTSDMDCLRLVLSHLLREEPWFDFLADAYAEGR